MRANFYDQGAPKKPAHLSINSDILRQAKLQRINISDVCERGLVEALKERKRQEWLASNKDAIEEYGSFIEENGCFADKLRAF